MVQVILASTVNVSGSTSWCGSTHFLGKHLRQTKQIHGIFGVGSPCLWYQGAQRLPLIGPSDLSRDRNLRVEAGWIFRGRDQGGRDQGLDASSERSESANEDILIFFFQLDLAIQVQRALNLEDYEYAQHVRNKLTEVETEVNKMQDGRRGSNSKSEAQDMAISILRLRSDLQNAVQSENYALAAELRDKISKLEAESLAATATAQLYGNVQYAFRLGQKVRHKIFGYRGVICGMDPFCCESSSWKDIAKVEKLSRGPSQPFYQVLVDVHSYPELLVVYVAEENLLAPDKPDKASFEHPYMSFLFYGMDAAGDFIPIKQLREKYNRTRHEIPYDEPEENGGDS